MKAQNIIHLFTYSLIRSVTLVFMFCVFMNAPAPAQSVYNYFNGSAFYYLDYNPYLTPPQLEVTSTQPVSIIKTADSNLFITGWGPWGSWTSHPDAPLSFIKSDPLGNLIWSTHLKDPLAVYPNPTHNYDIALAVQTEADSGYVAVVALRATELNMTFEFPWILKLDKNGQYQWAKYYSRDTSYLAQGVTPVQTMTSNYSGGFLLAVSYPDSISSYCSLINCDKDGNILWKKYYTGIKFNPTKIVKTPDYGYMICGANNPLGSTPALMKIDSSGNVQFYKSYTGSYSGYSISEWNNGQYFITGSTKMYNAFNSYSPFILSVDVLGNINWLKEYNGNGTEDSTVFASDITVLRNGDLLVCGNRVRNGTPELSYFKTDNSGNWIWSRSKKGPWATYEGQQLLKFGDDVLMTWNGSYNNFTFAHLSPAGEGICYDASQNWHEVSVSITSTSKVPAMDTNVIINILPPPITFQFIYGIPDSVVCPLTSAGIDEQNIESNILIYPNPSNGIFSINSVEMKIKTIEVINVLGEKVAHLQLLPKGGGQNSISLPSGGQPQVASVAQWALDLSSSPEGIYFVRINTSAGMISKKVVVMR
ncbi:MAG: T9SS type A sorting domain-containing protein [Bacteroidetes bacterium]|nr:T9SS type A sorting domain-containing protein [Bacteroidota bacterium]